MDIDHFKKINDQHGHAVGDAAIRHIASVAARVFRPYDFLARVGGEEFCAVIDDATTTDLHEVAERLRRAIEGSTLEADGVSLAMTVSVGYSRGSRSDASWNDVLSRADTALYRAKNSGRNLVGHPDDDNELPLPKVPLANRNDALATARMSNSSA
jgi:diguanylate cyclase (GGDEF)-like protein